MKTTTDKKEYMIMNKVILMGNLARDPERRTTQNGTSVTSFTVAVNRRFRNSDGGPEADFINCVAWRQTADFVAQYFQKGSRIIVTGSIQTRSYDDREGNKRYVTEVVVDDAEFAGPKGENGNSAPAETKKDKDPFEDELAGFKPMDDNELPF